jgi:glycosyltransferase involved in cell wall biosynthesis
MSGLSPHSAVCVREAHGTYPSLKLDYMLSELLAGAKKFDAVVLAGIILPVTKWLREKFMDSPCDEKGFELMSRPLISIVTVSLNSGKTIRRTIESVANQTYDRIELIVIDGGSTDDTLSITSDYADKVSRIISEPDRGIYDAMNKGIRAANGEWIHLLNSDDYYAASNAIESAVRVLDPARTNYFWMWRESADHQRVLQAWKYSRWLLFISAFLPHPALIVSRAQYDAIGLYDVNFRVAADHDMILRLTKRWAGRGHDFPLTVMQQGGVSEGNKLLSLREFERVSRRHGLPGPIARLVFVLKRIWWRT